MISERKLNGFLSLKSTRILKDVFPGLILAFNVFANTPNSGNSNYKKFSIAPLPVVYYTPETRLAYGASLSFFVQPDPERRPSSFFPILVYTQNKQMIAKVDYDIYSPSEKYHIFGRFGYYDYPETFWGVGRTPEEVEEDYTRLQWLFYFNPQQKVSDQLYVGAVVEFENTEFRDTQESGFIETKSVPGAEGGNVSGLGFMLNWDTRDHIYFPSKGSYNQIHLIGYENALIGDYRFTRLQLDIRKYFRFFSRHVLASRFYSEMTQGDVPFKKMGVLGGSERMRGYYEGRFRDKQQAVLQLDYRIPLSKYWGINLFGAMGDIAPELDKFSMNHIKVSYGAGVRFMLLQAQKINLRVDYGMSAEGGSLYVEVFEVF